MSMEPKRKWFRRGKYAVGVDVNSAEFVAEVAELRASGYHEVRVVEPNRTPGARAGQALVITLAAGVVALAASAIVVGIVLLWRAVL